MSAVAVQRSSHGSYHPPAFTSARASSPSSRNPAMSSSSPQQPAEQTAPSPQSNDESGAAPGASPSRTPQGKQPSDAQPDSSSKTTPPTEQEQSQIPHIKKEQASSPVPSRLAPVATTHSLVAPPAPTPRHRPRKLDLSKDKEIPASQGGMNGRPSAPLTSKESGGLSSLQDVGLACLSPGFLTRDPTMQHQMARSMEMRDQQRQIIEARMGKKDGPVENGARDGAFSRPLATSKRKGPPPGLSIHAPSAQQFADEPRIVQSAPLNQSFTGLKPSGAVHPLSRQVLDKVDHQQNRGEGSSLAAIAASQGSNRLPPIQDVFTSEHLGSSRRPSETLNRTSSGPQQPQLHHQRLSPGHPSAAHGGPHPSPGLLPLPPGSAGLQPPPHASTFPRAESNKSPFDQNRKREFKSAEEAVQTLSGGREELLPKLVHYGGHQPPTPPSPLPPGHPGAHHQPAPHHDGRSTSKRRRREDYDRDQYEQEDMREREKERQRAWEEERGQRVGPFGERRDSPETSRRKKEEFMSLCARAWDLFHS